MNSLENIDGELENTIENMNRMRWMCMCDTHNNEGPLPVSKVNASYL